MNPTSIGAKVAHALCAAGLAACAIVAACVEVAVPPQADVDPASPRPIAVPADRLYGAPREQTVPEGQIVLLRAVGLPDPGDRSVTYVWVQTSGPAVQLRGVFTPVASFIAPQVNADTVLTFRFVMFDQSELENQRAVVRVIDSTGPDRDRCAGVACPPGRQCDPDTGSCRASEDACAGVVCPAGQACDDATGRCAAANPCIARVCADDEICSPETGGCEPACPGLVCPAGQRADLSACTCFAAIPCAAACGPAQRCNEQTGQCEPVDRCASVTCGAGRACDPATGQCVTSEPCAAVSCPTGFSCAPATGKCVADDGCPDLPQDAVFRVAGSSVGDTRFTLMPEYWLEFDRPVRAETFGPELVDVLHAGSDNAWGTGDDATLSALAQLDCCDRVIVPLTPPAGELSAGRRYRVRLSPGCLRAAGSSADLGLDGEFNGAFPSGDGTAGGAFVHEFIGAAPGEYRGDLVCDEQTRDILGRVTREQIVYDDSIGVDPSGVLVFDGRPVQVGESMTPDRPGFEIHMVVERVAHERDGIAVAYDVTGQEESGYAFDGPQEETFTFQADGSIRHAGTSSFTIRGGIGVVGNFNRSCSGTLRR